MRRVRRVEISLSNSSAGTDTVMRRPIEPVVSTDICIPVLDLPQCRPRHTRDAQAAAPGSPRAPGAARQAQFPIDVVRKGRLELPRVAPLAPKASASTNSATFAASAAVARVLHAADGRCAHAAARSTSGDWHRCRGAASRPGRRLRLAPGAQAQRAATRQRILAEITPQWHHGAGTRGTAARRVRGAGGHCAGLESG